MDSENAIRIIENVYGFDDETSAVGEAWSYIKARMEKLEQIVKELEE